MYLFAEEHYYAHKLLYEENPHNRDLVYGWHCVSTKKGLKISAEEYAYVRQVYSDSLKEFHPSRGVPVKEEVKKRISKTHCFWRKQVKPIDQTQNSFWVGFQNQMV